MQSMKETASNIAASAKAGMEKTKATVGEKVEKMTTRDPVQKEMATQKKEERINQAELEKREAREHNAAAREATKAGVGHPVYTVRGTGGYGEGGMGSATYSTTGQPGHGTGGHQVSALPGQGTGQPTGQVTEGTVGAHPIGINTGTNTGTGRTLGHNTHVGGGTTGYGKGNTGHGTGGGYSG